MNARILDERVQLHSGPDSMSPAVGDLAAGDEVEIGAVKKAGSDTWVMVRKGAGLVGFMPAGTRIFLIKQAALNQPSVTAHMGPSGGSPVAGEYRRGEKFWLLGSVKEGDASWVRIRDKAGIQSYIDGKTKIRRRDVHRVLGADPVGDRPVRAGSRAIFPVSRLKHMGERTL